jgi:hypothetical protein
VVTAPLSAGSSDTLKKETQIIKKKQSSPGAVKHLVCEMMNQIQHGRIAGRHSTKLV